MKKKILIALIVLFLIFSYYAFYLPVRLINDINETIHVEASSIDQCRKVLLGSAGCADSYTFYSTELTDEDKLISLVSKYNKWDKLFDSISNPGGYACVAVLREEPRMVLADGECSLDDHPWILEPPIEPAIWWSLKHSEPDLGTCFADCIGEGTSEPQCDIQCGT